MHREGVNEGERLVRRREACTKERGLYEGERLVHRTTVRGFLRGFFLGASVRVRARLSLCRPSTQGQEMHTHELRGKEPGRQRKEEMNNRRTMPLSGTLIPHELYVTSPHGCGYAQTWLYRLWGQCYKGRMLCPLQ